MNKTPWLDREEAKDVLRQAIRDMVPRDKLYVLLKEELTQLGHWKNLPRGKHS